MGISDVLLNLRGGILMFGRGGGFRGGIKMLEHRSSSIIWCSERKLILTAYPG